MNKKRWIGFAGLAALAGVLLGTAPPATEAASLDKALLLNSGDVLAYLKEQKIKTIGVLPFQVKRGNRPASVSSSPLSTNLPERIENALIMVMDPDESRAVGIIRDASSAVSKARVGSYRTSKASYDKLFKPTYDLRWSGKRAKADAFLTGTVINAGNNRGETIVELQLLRPTSWKNGKLVPETIKRFKTRTDTMLVADLGYNFSLSPAALRRGLKATRRDDVVIDQVAREDEKGDKKVVQGQTSAHTPGNIAGFAFELEYNGEKQPLTPVAGGDGAKQPEYTVPTPPPGARITMYMTRLDESPRKLGVLLMVNGKSTFNLEDADPLACRKWIYGPETKGRRDEWRGFYTGTAGRNLLPFKALTAEESEAHMDKMGEKAGKIDIYVFASKEAGQAGGEKEKEAIIDDDKEGAKKDADKKEDDTEKKDAERKKDADKDEKPPVDDDKDMLITTRGMVRRSNAMSLKELRARLMKANNVKQKERLVASRNAGGLILHDVEPVEGGNFSTSDLPDPVMIGHLTIRYYEKGSGAPISD